MTASNELMDVVNLTLDDPVKLDMVQVSRWMDLLHGDAGGACRIFLDLSRLEKISDSEVDLILEHIGRESTRRELPVEVLCSMENELQFRLRGASEMFHFYSAHAVAARNSGASEAEQDDILGQLSLSIPEIAKVMASEDLRCQPWPLSMHDALGYIDESPLAIHTTADSAAGHYVVAFMMGLEDRDALVRSVFKGRKVSDAAVRDLPVEFMNMALGHLKSQLNARNRGFQFRFEIPAILGEGSGPALLAGFDQTTGLALSGESLRLYVLVSFLRK